MLFAAVKPYHVGLTPTRLFVTLRPLLRPPKWQSYVAPVNALSVKRSASTHWIQDPAWLGAITPKRVTETEIASFKTRVTELINVILKANWGDTFNLTLNVPFWEAEFEELHRQVRATPPLLSDGEVARCWVTLSTLLDLMFICEDLRDHLNELMEYMDRVTSREKGVKEKITNLGEHIKMTLERYDLMESKCPRFKHKIDESVGRGIELLRKRVKFDWKGLHAAYY